MANRLLPGDPTQVGDFHLTRRLGAGGMGQVYLARTAAGRQVVVKVIRPELLEDPDFRARFAREAEAARKVGGFHTASFVDADPRGDPPWIATAYIDAPSLHEQLRDGGPLEPGALRVLAAGLAEGLRAIHAAGLVHRDLKPGNILLAHDGPRIIDFGIARPLDTTHLTATGGVLGTLPFMSPEQTEGLRVGPPSDLFSLGTVLAAAGTGDNPFNASTPAATIRRIIGPPPSVDGLPPDLTDLIHHCWTHDPAQRPTPAQILNRITIQDAAGTWPSPRPADIPRPNTATQQPENPTPRPPQPPSPRPAPPLPGKPPRTARRRWITTGIAALALAIGALAWIIVPNPPPESDYTPPPRGIEDTLQPMRQDDTVLSVAFGPEAEHLAAASDDGTARLWDVATGNEAFTLHHGDTVRSVAFSSDAEQLATASHDGTARLWDVATGEETGSVQHDGWVRSVAFSPDGGQLATASDDGTARLWDVATGDEAFTLHHGDTVRSVAFSSDAEQLATASHDGTARLWDVATGDEAFTLHHGDTVLSVAFSPDGGQLAAASHDGTARLWDVATGDEAFTLHHDGTVWSVAFSPDGGHLATASGNRARLWDPTTGEEIPTE